MIYKYILYKYIEIQTTAKHKTNREALYILDCILFILNFFKIKN